MRFAPCRASRVARRPGRTILSFRATGRARPGRLSATETREKKQTLADDDGAFEGNVDFLGEGGGKKRARTENDGKL